MRKQKPPKVVTRLGTLIRAQRAVLGMTQLEVAVIAGVEKSHVWNIEQGLTRQPSPEVQAGLARALQLPVREIQDAIVDSEPLSEDEALQAEIAAAIRHLSSIERFEDQLAALRKFSPELYGYVLEAGPALLRLGAELGEAIRQSGPEVLRPDRGNSLPNGE